MSKREYKIKKCYRFGAPFYSIEVNGCSILELLDGNKKLANKIKKFLEEECADIKLWVDKYSDDIIEKALSRTNLDPGDFNTGDKSGYI